MTAMSLQKAVNDGTSAPLTNNGTAITTARIGCSWDAGSRGKKGIMARVSRKIGVDLDLVAVTLDSSGSPIRMCGPENLDVFSGALKHSGDEKKGHKEGLDEYIDVDLSRMRADVEGVVFAVTAMKPGMDFSAADNVDVHVFDVSSGEHELAVYSPPLNTSDNVICFCVIDRDDANPSVWNLTTIKKTVKATDRESLFAAVKRLSS